MIDGHVQALLDDEILQDIFNEMENDALEAGVRATTDTARYTAMRDVQLIRDFRERLVAKAKDPTPTRTPAVA